MRNALIASVLAIVVLVVACNSVFVVDETETALVLRFGDIQQTNLGPGLHAKAPFVDTVDRFDRRVLRIDADPESMRDSKKENLVIDSYARYKIIDVVQFRKTLLTEDNAFRRLGDIVNSTLREEIARRTRPEIIGARQILDVLGNPVEDEEGLPLFEGTESRSALLRDVLQGVRVRVAARETTKQIPIPTDIQGEATFDVLLEQLILDADNADGDSDLTTGVGPSDIRVVTAPDGGETEGFDIVIKLWSPATLTVTLGVQAGEKLNQGDTITIRYFTDRDDPFGIDIVDVRIKRADFPDSVTPSIFTRMRAERNRIATRFRAEGDEQDLTIRASANKDREVILATADKEANEVRGQGEAEAIRILAEALEADPEFFAFRRSLEAYHRVLNTGTTVILSADADLFRFLDSPGGAASNREAP